MTGWRDTRPTPSSSPRWTRSDAASCRSSRSAHSCARSAPTPTGTTLATDDALLAYCADSANPVGHLVLGAVRSPRRRAARARRSHLHGSPACQLLAGPVDRRDTRPSLPAARDAGAPRPRPRPRPAGRGLAGIADGAGGRGAPCPRSARVGPAAGASGRSAARPRGAAVRRGWARDPAQDRGRRIRRDGATPHGVAP